MLLYKNSSWEVIQEVVQVKVIQDTRDLHEHFMCNDVLLTLELVILLHIS